MLDNYGEAEAKRSRVLKRAALAVGVVAAIALAGYLLLRNHGEKKQLNTFLDLLRAKNYQGAYALWGCTEATPCREYPFDKFMRDWGPESSHPGPEAMRLAALKSCDAGVIQLVQWGDDEIRLWVNRSDRTLSFAPWPVCNPRMKAP